MALLAQRHRDRSCLPVLPPQTSNVSWERRGSLPGSFPTLLQIRERLQIAGSQKGLPWKAVAQPHLPMALLAQRHRDWGYLLVLHLKLQTHPGIGGGPCQAPFAALLRIRERLQIAGSQKRLDWKAVAQPHLPMALLGQRHRDLGCLLVLPPQTSNVSQDWKGSLPGSFRSPDLKMRTSADSWQPEGTSLESCCSFSSAHGTTHTEAQR